MYILKPCARAYIYKSIYTVDLIYIYIFGYKQYTFHFPPAWDEVGFWCTRSLLFQFCLPAWQSPECCIIAVIMEMSCFELGNAL